MPKLIDNWPAGFDGLGNDASQLNPLFAKVNLAAADSAQVQQVINQVHQLPQLALHH